jgi:hypothetical protein
VTTYILIEKIVVLCQLCEHLGYGTSGGNLTKPSYWVFELTCMHLTKQVHVYLWMQVVSNPTNQTKFLLSQVLCIL